MVYSDFVPLVFTRSIVFNIQWELSELRLVKVKDTKNSILSAKNTNKIAQ